MPDLCHAEILGAKLVEAVHELCDREGPCQRLWRAPLRDFAAHLLVAPHLEADAQNRDSCSGWYKRGGRGEGEDGVE